MFEYTVIAKDGYKFNVEMNAPVNTGDCVVLEGQTSRVEVIHGDKSYIYI